MASISRRLGFAGACVAALLSASFVGAQERRHIVPDIDPEQRTRFPSTATVLTEDDIRYSGVRYLSDILRMVPGMEVMRTTSTASNASLRGFSEDATAAQGIMVLIDGRQAYNEFYGNAFWDLIPVELDEIKLIEVIRGPMSFLYGPNAMHGLVNIITKTPKDYDRDDGSDYYRFSVRAGTYDSIVSSLTYSKWDKQEKSGLKTVFVFDDIGQFESDRSGSRDKRFAELSYTNQVGEDDEHTFGLTTTISDQAFDLVIPRFVSGAAPTIPPAVYRSQAREATFKGDYRDGNFRAKGVWVGFDADSVANLFYESFKVDVDTFDLDLLYSFQLMEDHFLTAGAGARYSIFSTAEENVSNGKHDTNLAWAFMQDEVELQPNLFFTGGIRFDRHSEAGNNPSPRAALVWQFLEQHALRTSYGTGFRFPSMRENWFHLPVNVPSLPTLTVGGNQGLVAEELRSLELGYSGIFEITEPVTGTETDPDADARVDKISSTLEIGLTGYYNKIDNLVSFQPTTSPPGRAPQNTDNDEAFGIEFEAKAVHSEEFMTFLNYSWGQRRDRATHTRNPIAPRHKGNIGFRWSPQANAGSWDGVRAMLWASYFDATRVFDVTVGDHVMLNGSFSYPFLDNNKARVFVEGFNLLDNDHREHPDGDSYGAMVSAGVTVTF